MFLSKIYDSSVFDPCSLKWINWTHLSSHCSQPALLTSVEIIDNKILPKYMLKSVSKGLLAVQKVKTITLIRIYKENVWGYIWNLLNGCMVLIHSSFRLDLQSSPQCSQLRGWRQGASSRHHRHPKVYPPQWLWWLMCVLWLRWAETFFNGFSARNSLSHSIMRGAGAGNLFDKRKRHYNVSVSVQSELVKAAVCRLVWFIVWARLFALDQEAHNPDYIGWVTKHN